MIKGVFGPLVGLPDLNTGASKRIIALFSLSTGPEV